MESEAVSQHQTNQSTWGAKDSFLLYFSFLFFYFFSSYNRFRVGLLNLFIGSEIVNCSEVLKLKFIYDYYLNSMNSRQKLEIISSIDCSYSEIFLISISVYTVIQFSRT